jgi:hypothetical protein
MKKVWLRFLSEYSGTYEYYLVPEDYDCRGLTQAEIVDLPPKWYFANLVTALLLELTDNLKIVNSVLVQLEELKKWEREYE